MNRYVVAITGASGMIYARELLAYFGGRPDLELHAVISGAGEQVLKLELELDHAALDRHGHDGRSPGRMGVGHEPADGLALHVAGTQIGVVLMPPIGAGIRGVGFPVVAGQAVAPDAARPRDCDSGQVLVGPVDERADRKRSGTRITRNLDG